ncbi:hypothetical protein Tco_0458415, partial [Tanacetum coccineum]
MAADPKDMQQRTIMILSKELLVDVTLAKNLLLELNRYLDQLKNRDPEMLRLEALGDHTLINFDVTTMDKLACADMINSQNLMSTRTDLMRTIAEKEELLRRYRAMCLAWIDFDADVESMAIDGLHHSIFPAASQLFHQSYAALASSEAPASSYGAHHVRNPCNCYQDVLLAEQGCQDDTEEYEAVTPRAGIQLRVALSTSEPSETDAAYSFVMYRADETIKTEEYWPKMRSEKIGNRSCGIVGHYQKDCPKIKNQNRGKQARFDPEASGRVHMQLGEVRTPSEMEELPTQQTKLSDKGFIMPSSQPSEIRVDDSKEKLTMAIRERSGSEYMDACFRSSLIAMIMAASAIIISSDSSDETVGSPPSRVILFGDIPTVIPSTFVVAPETSTIALVISPAAPMVETTFIASPTGLCGLVPYTGSDSDSPD